MRSFVAALSLFLLVVLVGCSSEPDGTAGTSSHGTYGADLPNVDTTDDPMTEGSGERGDDGVLGDVGDEDTMLVGADESVAANPAVPDAGTTSMKTTANVNLRKGPGTSYAILLVIPSGSIVSLVSTTQQNAFYNVTFGGSTGWVHSAYLAATSSSPSPGPAVDPNGAPSPDNALARAAASTGFSYYWGGGAWTASGATSSNKGSCSGSCPSCSHSGKFGADCSGMVAKAWQYGTKDLEVNSHPYGTVHFVKDVAGKWSTVSRGAMKKGDALVYNSGGAGHIVIYEKGDGWGSPTVYECKGCSYGCVHNTRSISSSYHAIRRSGF